MGCWNQTDYVSRLPIHAGEDVVVIMLSKNEHSEDFVHNCYTIDNYIPFGYPIYGKYNDYGGIEEVENVDDIVSYLQTTKLYEKKYNNKKSIYEYEEIEITKENFYKVMELLCQGELFEQKVTQEVIKETPTSLTMSEPKIKYFRYELMFVKRDLYDELIKEVENRITYEGITILEAFTKHLNESIDKLKKCAKCEDDFLFNSKIYSIYPNTIYWRSNCKCIRAFILKKLVENFDEIQFNYLKNINFFTTALMMLRTGYYVVTGDGSQSEEMLMHKKLAEYIIKQTKAQVKRYRKYSKNEDVTDEEILTEKISY